MLNPVQTDTGLQGHNPKYTKTIRSLHSLNKLLFRTLEQEETSCFQPYGTG